MFTDLSEPTTECIESLSYAVVDPLLLAMTSAAVRICKTIHTQCVLNTQEVVALNSIIARFTTATVVVMAIPLAAVYRALQHVDPDAAGFYCFLLLFFVVAPALVGFIRCVQRNGSNVGTGGL